LENKIDWSQKKDSVLFFFKITKKKSEMGSLPSICDPLLFRWSVRKVSPDIENRELPYRSIHAICLINRSDVPIAFVLGETNSTLKPNECHFDRGDLSRSYAARLLDPLTGDTEILWEFADGQLEVEDPIEFETRVSAQLEKLGYGTVSAKNEHRDYPCGRKALARKGISIAVTFLNKPTQ
jgi:hypothetical protein